jgi:HJR/Mrr/RecB family endonuclease
MVLSWMLSGLIPDAVRTYKEKHPSKNLLAYREALRLYEVECKAAHEAEMRKRSYWQCLDGYEFERATAEVLRKHQFTTMVTPGSGDGGIDIEVTRNGLRGVVQCKAHVACVGPHVVRDLYGVIHHSGADFGIVVSRGGFTQGAVDFTRNKPILFVDISDLIAMQEGRDVLAKAFSRKDTCEANGP